MYTLHVMIF